MLPQEVFAAWCWPDEAPLNSLQFDRKCRFLCLWHIRQIRSFSLEISFLLPDWCVFNDDLHDLTVPEDVPVQPLYVAVDDAEVGNLDAVRLPQPHRHAGQVGVLAHDGDPVVTLSGAVAGVDAELGAGEVRGLLILSKPRYADNKQQEWTWTI